MRLKTVVYDLKRCKKCNWYSNCKKRLEPDNPDIFSCQSENGLYNPVKRSSKVYERMIYFLLTKDRFFDVFSTKEIVSAYRFSKEWIKTPETENKARIIAQSPISPEEYKKAYSNAENNIWVHAGFRSCCSNPAHSYFMIENALSVRLNNEQCDIIIVRISRDKYGIFEVKGLEVSKRVFGEIKSAELNVYAYTECQFFKVM